MTRVLSFDPATRHVGWAQLEDGRLARCGLAREPIEVELVQLSSELRRDLVVVEVPQVYQQRSWKGDPNDLIDVAVVAGRIAQEFGDGAEVRLVRPHAWKGSVPKDVMLRRIENRLDDRERSVLHAAKAPASLLHNVVDAVGIGLWAIGRLGKR